MLQTLRRILRPAKQEFAPNPSSSSEFEINNWAVSAIVAANMLPAVGSHPFPLNELMLMAGAVARVKPAYIFEWGTHIGKSARAFHEAAKAMDIPVTIHSIDLPDDVEHGEHPHTERGKLVKGVDNVELHQGDGLDTSLGIMSKLSAKHKMGSGILFFVDGDHSYESVKRELRGIMKLAPLAAVLLHDTFYQSKDSGYNVGPSQAISECLVKSPGHYKRIDTNTGLPGMTLLYPQSTNKG